MDYVACIANGCFKLELVGETKEAVIREMVDLLFREGKIREREPVLTAVLNRERQLSTGMQYGVAIPHGKTDTVDELVVGLEVVSSTHPSQVPAAEGSRGTGRDRALLSPPGGFGSRASRSP